MNKEGKIYAVNIRDVPPSVAVFAETSIEAVRIALARSWNVAPELIHSYPDDYMADSGSANVRRRFVAPDGRTIVVTPSRAAKLPRDEPSLMRFCGQPELPLAA